MGSRRRPAKALRPAKSRLPAKSLRPERQPHILPPHAPQPPRSRGGRAPPPRSPRSQSVRPRSARPRPLPESQPGRLPAPGRAQELRRPRGARRAGPRRGRAGAAGGQGRSTVAKPPPGSAAGQPAGGGGGARACGCGWRAAGRLTETCPSPRAPGIVPITSATTKPANVMVPVPPARVHLPLSSRLGCEEGRRGRSVPLIPHAAHPCRPPPGSSACGGRASGARRGAQPRGAAGSGVSGTCRSPPESGSGVSVLCRSRSGSPDGDWRSPASGAPSGSPASPGRHRPLTSLRLPRRPAGLSPLAVPLQPCTPLLSRTWGSPTSHLLCSRPRDYRSSYPSDTLTKSRRRPGKAWPRAGARSFG